MTPYRADLSLPFPAQQQLKNFPAAIKRECPVCNAQAGAPCLPSSLSIPHLARCKNEGSGA